MFEWGFWFGFWRFGFVLVFLLWFGFFLGGWGGWSVLLSFVLNKRMNSSQLKIITAPHGPSSWPVCSHAFFFLSGTPAQLQKEGLATLSLSLTALSLFLSDQREKNKHLLKKVWKCRFLNVEYFRPESQIRQFKEQN